MELYHLHYVLNFCDSIDFTSMELKKLWCKKFYASSQVSAPKFGCEIWQTMISNLWEVYGMVQGVKVICDNCQFYACKSIDHITKFCQIQLWSQGGRSIQQQPLNNMKVAKYKKTDEIVSGNRDHSWTCIVTLSLSQNRKNTSLEENSA